MTNNVLYMERHMKNDKLSTIIAIIFIIVCVIVGIFVASGISNSDLPEWLKIYLLTH